MKPATIETADSCRSYRLTVENSGETRGYSASARKVVNFHWLTAVSGWTLVAESYGESMAAGCRRPAPPQPQVFPPSRPPSGQEGVPPVERHRVDRDDLLRAVDGGT